MDTELKVRWENKPKNWEVVLLNLLGEQRELLAVIKRILMEQETRELQQRATNFNSFSS